MTEANEQDLTEQEIVDSPEAPEADVADQARSAGPSGDTVRVSGETPFEADPADAWEQSIPVPAGEEEDRPV